MSADLAKLGDALDAAESAWDAAHPEFAGQALLWSVKVDKAFARYRMATRDEVTKRHRKPSEYARRIASMTFPDDATSLRELLDAEARGAMSGYTARLNAKHQLRSAKRSARRQMIRRAAAHRRSLGFAC